jgi:uncharacterized protein DUF3987
MPDTLQPPVAEPSSAWPELDSALIDDGRGTMPLFPLELLPLPWRGWVGERARAAGAPVDYVAAAVLAAVAGVCGAGVRARVTPDWTEPVVLWQVLVGPPSSGKSPALKPVRHLLSSVEGELPRPDSGEAPHIIVETPTLGAVAHAVSINPRGVLLWRDEPSDWLAELDRPQWRGAWRGAWSADQLTLEGDVADDRVVLGTVAVSVFGTLRPERLMRPLGESDGGLAARFLYVWPDPAPYCPLAERRPSNQEQALSLLRRILKVARTPGNPLVLALDAETLKDFDGFLSCLHRDRATAEGLEAEWLGKGSGTVARLAAILELLAWSGADSGAAPQQIRRPAMQGAIRLWDEYFRPHAAQVFGRAGRTDLLRQARRVVRWLQSARKAEVTREEVRRYGLGTTVDAAGADLVIGRLAAGGVLDLILNRGPLPAGRPTRRWRVNPVLLE